MREGREGGRGEGRRERGGKEEREGKEGEERREREEGEGGGRVEGRRWERRGGRERRRYVVTHHGMRY